MSVRKVITIGDPRLKRKNLHISDFKSGKLKQLIRDLKDTMIKEDLVGIAAPQIAENYLVFVTQPRNTKTRNLGKEDKFRVYINPKIVFLSKDQVVIYEGCGCVPGIFGPVRRPIEVEVQAQNEKGSKFLLRADGLLSRVIQHEYDHMSGIEFIEKISDYKKIMTKENYIKRVKNSLNQTKASRISKIEYKKYK